MEMQNDGQLGQIERRRVMMVLIGTINDEH